MKTLGEHFATFKHTDAAAWHTHAALKVKLGGYATAAGGEATVLTSSP